jgi:hypothetical protein
MKYIYDLSIYSQEIYQLFHAYNLINHSQHDALSTRLQTRRERVLRERSEKLQMEKEM